MTTLEGDRVALRKSRRHSVAFWLVAVTHCTLTFVFTLWSLRWQVLLLDTGGRVAPIGLRIVSAIDFFLALPVFLPLARLALYVGFTDPINDPVYWPLPIINSLLVAYGVTATIRWLTARRRAFRPAGGF